jgi:exodeoxyribonuclease-1
LSQKSPIYSGGFTSAKDQALFPKFHTGDWKEKFALLDKFEDERLVTFGHGLIFNEAPEILPKEVTKKSNDE